MCLCVQLRLCVVFFYSVFNDYGVLFAVPNAVFVVFFSFFLCLVFVVSFFVYVSIFVQLDYF